WLGLGVVELDVRAARRLQLGQRLLERERRAHRRREATAAGADIPHSGAERRAEVVFRESGRPLARVVLLESHGYPLQAVSFRRRQGQVLTQLPLPNPGFRD